MEEILRKINKELIRLTKKLASERRHPSPNTDASDETMADCEERIKALRTIRTTIEDTYI